MVPKVSIIVPVYNCEKYISECLNSIINQTYKNIEVVIINDGSTDNSERIINEYVTKDARLLYVYQDNGGPSKARNTGILTSTGEYLTFVDSDDTVDKCYVELLVNKMLHTNADLVCCSYTDFSEYGVLKCIDFNFDYSVSVHFVIDMVCKGTGGVMWGKIYRKEIIDKYELKLDKDIFMCEDLVFVLQYVSKSRSFASIEVPLYNYNRCNQYSISSNISISYVQNYITVCERIEGILHNVGLDGSKIQNIITDKIQSFVLQLVENQSMEIRVIGIKNAVKNITRILDIPHIKKYIGTFSTNAFLYKPYVFLIKNNFILISVLYGMYLHGLKSIKRKIKMRK